MGILSVRPSVSPQHSLRPRRDRDRSDEFLDGIARQEQGEKAADFRSGRLAPKSERILDHAASSKLNA